MANKRDVELTIRAKNEASKAIDSVSEALKELAKVQEDVSKSAGKTGGLLDRLGTELKKLNAETKGLEGLGKIAGSIDKASAAIKRMEAELAGTNADLSRLKTEQTNAAASANQLAAAIKLAATALTAQKTATAAARAEQTAANREVRAAEASINRLASRIAAAKKPNDELAASLQKQQAALGALKTRQDAASSGFTKQQAATKAAANALKELQDRARAAASNQKLLDSAADKTAVSLARQSKALESSKADLSEIQNFAKTAAVALGGVAVAQDKITAASGQTAIALAKVNAALATASSSRATAGPSGANLVTQQYKAQVEAVGRAKVAYAEAGAAATKLGAALRTATAPTAELQRAFLLAQTSARAAKTEYQQQAVALNQLRGVTQGTVGAFLQRAQLAQQAANADRGAAQSATTLAGVLRALGQAFLGINGAASQAAASVHKVGGAFHTAGNGSRQALGLFQRIRGELLGLSAQYVGLYAAITNIGGVVNAYRTIEAAQNRLGAVFDQDANKIGKEMTFLQSQANRLGIQFGVLADEYSKFAIAGDAANFSAESTRDIFLAVAEAGRVNKLSIENMSGVFLALTQMISKGKVTSEELRRQLGDRLPGAFNIFANAIGVTTAQLDEMLRAGDVISNETTMLKFADELSERFGNQLPASLRTVTTEIGRFQNNIFQAQAQVAKGGFIESLRIALENLNKFFRSEEGVKFFTSVGAALGKFVEILAQAPQYFGLIGQGIKLIVAFKLAQVFTGIAGSLRAFNIAAVAGGRAMFTFSGNTKALAGTMAGLRGALAGLNLAAFRSSMTGLSVGMKAAAVGAGALRVGFVAVAGSARLLMGALGGPIGLLITLGTVLATEVFASWASDVDEATDALAQHERIVNAVTEAYSQTNGKIDDMGKKLKDVNALQVGTQFQKLRDAAEEAMGALQRLDSLTIGADLFGARETTPIKDLLNEFQNGKKTVQQFRDELAEMAKTLKTAEGIELAAKLDDMAAKFQKLETAAGDMAKIGIDLGLNMDGMAEAAANASKAVEAKTEVVKSDTAAMQAGVEANLAYNEAMLELKKNIPSLKKELEEAEKFVKLLTDGFNALKAALATDGLNQFGAALQALATGDTFALLQALQGIATGDFSKVGDALSTFGKGISEQGAASNNQIFEGATGVLDATTRLIAKLENPKGPALSPFMDIKQNGQPDRLRIGFSSDTVTLADGSVREVTAGMRISIEDANRDLARRISDIMSGLQNQLGTNFDRMTDEQKAVLASISYNSSSVGKIPEKIAAVINKGGSAADIAAAIRSTGGGVLTGRRNNEASLFEQGGGKFDEGGLDARLEQEKQITEEKTKQAEKEAEARQAIQQKIADGTFEIEQLAEAGRQAAINKAIRDAENEAKKAGIQLTVQERNAIAENAGVLFDAQNKEKEAVAQKEAIEKRVNDLYQLRKELMEQITFAQEQGQGDKAEQLKVQLTETDNKLKEAIADAQQFYATMGGPGADLAIAKLNGMSNSIQTVKQGFLDTKQVTDSLVSGLGNFFNQAAQGIAKVIQEGGSLKDIFKSIGQAFLKFAADFLIQMGQMIIKQALMNALQGGGKGGGIGGILGGLFHGGGKVGTAGPKRLVNPAWYKNAPRFHGGGVAGIKSNEIPAILKKNEEVLTEDDPRHADNGGLMGGRGGTKIVNTFDAPSFLQAALGTNIGERAILNYVKANSGAIKAALG